MTKEQIKLALEAGYKIEIESNNGKKDIIYHIDEEKEHPVIGDNGIYYIDELNLLTAKIPQEKPKLLPIGTKVKVFDWVENRPNITFVITNAFGNEYTLELIDNSTYETSFSFSEVYPVFENKKSSIPKSEKIPIIPPKKSKNSKKYYWWIQDSQLNFMSTRSIQKYTKKEAKEMYGDRLIGKVK